MSYLTLNPLAAALNMNKVTISLWFRIPTATAQAVAAQTVVPYPDNRVLQGVIPLLMFGGQQSATWYDQGLTSAGVSTTVTDNTLGQMWSGAVSNTATTVVGSHQTILQPSSIGVRVGGIPDSSLPPGAGGLDVNIQTKDHATGTNLFQIPSGYAPGIATLIAPPAIYTESYWDNVANYQATGIPTGFTDSSYVVTSLPEYFGNSDLYSIFGLGGYPTITYDKWHHLLISWDLTGGSGATGLAPTITGGTSASYPTPDTVYTAYSHMWCAIDDVNQNGPNLPAMCIDTSVVGSSGGGISDPNAMVSNSAYNLQGSAVTTWSGTGFGTILTPFQEQVALTPSSIPSTPLWIPGPPTLRRPAGHGSFSTLSPSNQHVMMAELQIFTGIALDTSVEANRRAFVGPNGKPVKFPAAQKVMGKKPDIALVTHSKNWIIGKDLGIESKPNNFKPKGRIKTYFPSPQLGK